MTRTVSCPYCRAELPVPPGHPGAVCTCRLFGPDRCFTEVLLDDRVLASLVSDTASVYSPHRDCSEERDR